MKTSIEKFVILLYQLLDRISNTTPKTVQNLIQLSPGKPEQELKKKYYMGKIRMTITIIFIGSLIALFLWVCREKGNLLQDGVSIYRNKPGYGAKDITLTAEGNDGETANISLSIEDCSYTDEELMRLYKDFLKKVEPIILGDNDSWKCVSQDLNLVDGVIGYPFHLQWESADCQYLSDSGKLIEWIEFSKKNLNEKQVQLCMKVIYRHFTREYIFNATINPKPGKNEFKSIVQTMTEEIQNSTLSQRIIDLPQQVNGVKINWTEKEDNRSLTILLLSICSAIVIWIMKDRQTATLVQKRKLKMDEEYQVIISKLTLYLGAGMNLNGAWIKVAKEGNENPVYKEMLQTCREMEAGVSVKEAYERFARRVRQQQYIKLITLLVQNLKKGNSEILVLLKQESLLAMENHHALVKRRGEEMGTKLLFPMILMLGMVMILIIVPVFLSM